MQKNIQKSLNQLNRQEADDKRRSRRNLLGKGLAAFVALGAGAFLNKGIADAHTNIPVDNIGNFSSSDGVTPLMPATARSCGATLLAPPSIVPPL